MSQINHFVLILADKVPPGLTDPEKIKQHATFIDSQGHSVSTAGKVELETAVAVGDTLTFFFSPSLSHAQQGNALTPGTGHIYQAYRYDTEATKEDPDKTGSITVDIDKATDGQSIPYGLKVKYKTASGEEVDIDFDPIIQVRSSGN